MSSGECSVTIHLQLAWSTSHDYQPPRVAITWGGHAAAKTSATKLANGRSRTGIAQVMWASRADTAGDVTADMIVAGLAEANSEAG